MINKKSIDGTEIKIGDTVKVPDYNWFVKVTGFRYIYGKSWIVFLDEVGHECLLETKTVRLEDIFDIFEPPWDERFRKAFG